MSNIHSFLPPGVALTLADLQTLSDAFDLAVLELPSGHDAALEEKLGRAIVDVALAGDRDPVALCDKALARAFERPAWSDSRERSRDALPRVRRAPTNVGYVTSVRHRDVPVHRPPSSGRTVEFERVLHMREDNMTAQVELENRIRNRAYQIWQDAGCPDGQAEHHWELARSAVAEEDGRASLDGRTLTPSAESVEATADQGVSTQEERKAVELAVPAPATRKARSSRTTRRN
jgi:hypothetical protein